MIWDILFSGFQWYREFKGGVWFKITIPVGGTAWVTEVPPIKTTILIKEIYSSY